MLERYQTKLMKKNWSEEEKYFVWLKIELSYLENYILINKLSDIDIEKIKIKFEKIDIKNFIKKIKKYEEKTRHDVVAFLYAIKDEIGGDAKYIHKGLTSSDIVDTAFSLRLINASSILLDDLEELLKTLFFLAKKYKGMICLGRTHGQAAEASTVGLKFLSFYAEFKRHKNRLLHSLNEIKFGKLSGAIGLYTFSDPNIEKMSLKKLGLKPEEISTQIISRDRYADYFCTIAIIAGGIEKLALQIRLLSQTEVNEINEPFFDGQKGSSAMPHKKNPILSENLCGLSRLMRSYALVSLENQALWHERDISHSSSERVIAEDATSLLDFSLNRLNLILKNLVINKEIINTNYLNQKDKLKSQKILDALIEKNIDRINAHDFVQNNGYMNFFTKDELTEIFKEDRIKYEDLIFKRFEE